MHSFLLWHHLSCSFLFLRVLIMRYLLHQSQFKELHARQTYLYDIFHLYFVPTKSEGNFIVLVPLGRNIPIYFSSPDIQTLFGSTCFRISISSLNVVLLSLAVLGTFSENLLVTVKYMFLIFVRICVRYEAAFLMDFNLIFPMPSFVSTTHLGP